MSNTRPPGEKDRTDMSNTRPPGEKDDRTDMSDTRPPGEKDRTDMSDTRPPGEKDDRTDMSDTRPPGEKDRTDMSDTRPPGEKDDRTDMSDTRPPGEKDDRTDMSDTRPPGEKDRTSPVGTPHTASASSTDVAPTREARRRPRDCHPSWDPQLSPSTHQERQPTVVAGASSVLQGGWGYWGSWGKTLLSTATATVTTVGQGLTQVMEKAETSLGIPSPAELSSQVQEEERQTGEARAESDVENADRPSTVAMGMLSSLSSVVQSTSKTVISGGLDALEFLGKKTMDVIAEGDPGFRRTKGLMIRPSTLSEVLREAKEQEEQDEQGSGASGGPGPERRRMVHYGRLFDEFQGLAHLEALEALSRESQAKVGSVLATVSGEQQAALRDHLELIRDAFSLEELDDDELDDKQGESQLEEELQQVFQETSRSSQQPLMAWRQACQLLTDMSTTPEEEQEEKEEQEEQEEKEDVLKRFTVEEVHTAAISSLAEVTAHSIKHLLRAGEKMLLFLPDQEEQEEQKSSVEQSRALAQVTVVLCKEISLLSKKFTSCLTSIGANEKGEVLNPLITGVFLEASNSASYLQDAFQLLLPVLQISHIQRTSGAQQ